MELYISFEELQEIAIVGCFTRPDGSQGYATSNLNNDGVWVYTADGYDCYIENDIPEHYYKPFNDNNYNYDPTNDLASPIDEMVETL